MFVPVQLNKVYTCIFSNVIIIYTQICLIMFLDIVYKYIIIRKCFIKFSGTLWNSVGTSELKHRLDKFGDRCPKFSWGRRPMKVLSICGFVWNMWNSALLKILISNYVLTLQRVRSLRPGNLRMKNIKWNLSAAVETLPRKSLKLFWLFKCEIFTLRHVWRWRVL